MVKRIPHTETEEGNRNGNGKKTEKPRGAENEEMWRAGGLKVKNTKTKKQKKTRRFYPVTSTTGPSERDDSHIRLISFVVNFLLYRLIITIQVIKSTHRIST